MYKASKPLQIWDKEGKATIAKYHQFNKLRNPSLSHSARVKEFGRFLDRNDVYNFRVFLLELVSGREVLQSESLESDRSLVEWRMPLVGFGTVTYPMAASDSIKSAILNGIKTGYRHFDTASLYQTEQALGEAIKEALALGLVKSREEFFITSKLWCSDAHQDRVLPALQNSLRGACLPNTKRGSSSLGFQICMGNHGRVSGSWPYEVYRRQQFFCKELEVLNTFCPFQRFHPLSINLATKQVERVLPSQRYHCNRIFTFGAKGTSWGTNSVMDSEVLSEIAKAKGKTHAQICLRWAYEQGVCVVVKSFNEERMQSNLQIFDWALNPAEHKLIGQIPQERSNATS
ncbi:hypothetical protein IFM89_005407 [Coptis chinensis]|uniref:NADP-dependent oxidoreductase domain-containing protein n=1 Tax=Coptis chinensis TaxID=261450 RepID=A0A835IX22_9MAGN|nr:hypothetical protein IFM89_005407 [Coptis chinensis]